MKRIGTTSTGNTIVELSPDEWIEFLLKKHNITDCEPITGSDIRTYRKASGITQSEAAKYIGISRNYLSQIERGEAGGISLDVYQRLVAFVSSKEPS